MNLAQHDTEAVFCIAHFRHFTQLNRKGRRNAGHAQLGHGLKSLPCSDRSQALVVKHAEVTERGHAGERLAPYP